jgi:hypothetical protein
MIGISEKGSSVPWPWARVNCKYPSIDWGSCQTGKFGSWSTLLTRRRVAGRMFQSPVGKQKTVARLLVPGLEIWLLYEGHQLTLHHSTQPIKVAYPTRFQARWPLEKDGTSGGERSYLLPIVNLDILIPASLTPNQDQWLHVPRQRRNP